VFARGARAQAEGDVEMHADTGPDQCEGSAAAPVAARDSMSPGAIAVPLTVCPACGAGKAWIGHVGRRLVCCACRRAYDLIGVAWVARSVAEVAVRPKRDLREIGPGQE